MFEIDCTVLPQAVTDFAFDHLHDDVVDNDVDNITIDYDNQIVEVDTGSMENAYTVRDIIQERAREKLRDLKFETEQGYETGFDMNEIQAARAALNEITVTA